MSELKERVIAYNTEVKEALQAIYNDLNQGQRKKLLRNPAIRAMFERYEGRGDGREEREGVSAMNERDMNCGTDGVKMDN